VATGHETRRPTMIMRGGDRWRHGGKSMRLRRDLNVGGPEVKEGDRTKQPDDDGDQLEWNWRPREGVYGVSVFRRNQR
jgi:hypothetical protein